MKLQTIAHILSCELEGDGSIEITGVSTLESATEGELSFLSNQKYHNAAKRTKASAILVSRDCAPMGVALLRHENPYLAFAKAVEVFFKPAPLPALIHPTAWVADSAVIGRDVYVGPRAVVGEHVVLGDKVVVHSGCILHEGASIGDGTLLHSGCVVRERAVIGKRCILQNNAVIGSDGFGFARQSNGEWYKIIQTGTVVIEDEVEVGACSAIDRPTIGETRIKRGTKIDNLVHIGHACVVGPDNLLCAQVGLAGSTRTGSGVVLTGQVGVAGHLTIGDGAIVTPQSGIASSIEEGQTVSGSPAIDHMNWLRSSAAFSKLPNLQKTVRSLESRVSTLEKALEGSEQKVEVATGQRGTDKK